jgi:16S rRNA (adenine1518-N6/adenine1519-N6)-dimethyltransferase
VVKAHKQFGQHWLKSEKALAKIVSAADLSKSDRVLEIGPGTGILTRPLLDQAGSVVAVEVDRDLCDLLAKRLGKVENFLLLQGDFLTLDLAEALAGLPHPNKVVANIPYNITGPIVEKLLGKISQPALHNYESIVLLVQKEVALRMCAKAGNTNFGALSVRVQYLADCEMICDVPAKAFEPPPKVDSAVIRLRPRPIGMPPQSPAYMETLLRQGFTSRRKMLRNNLKSVIEPERLNGLLEALGLNPQVRAEDLNVADWVRFADALQAVVADRLQIEPAIADGPATDGPVTERSGQEPD